MASTTIILFTIGLYLAVLIGIGLLANKRRTSNSLKDFYLAGSGLGPFVLLLTLYATQYSANTMLVTPAEVVNRGMGMILILGYMTAIVIFFLTFAPQLYQISRAKNFITPGDWVDYRFNSQALTLLCNIVLVVVSINFLLSQLMAMGHITNGVTEGQIPYRAGVVFLALVVIVYETLGGMRAVAWTDVIQGLMLLVGLGGLFLMLVPGEGELAGITAWLAEHEPEKVQVPDASFRIYWMSTVLMLGLGGAVYPQIIQRIYAARSVKTLRRSLSAMVWMPLVTVLVLFLMGVLSIPHFAGNPPEATDEVLPEMLRVWGAISPLAFFLTLMVIVGLLAAIMSTADSVLLSLSSIVAKDILGQFVMKKASDEQLTRAGKVISWVVMGLLVLLALEPRITLWGLIELKMQILVQTAPLFLLGLHSRRVDARSMLFGLVAGLAFALVTFFLGVKTVAEMQTGFIGLLLNIGVCLVFSKQKQVSEATVSP